MIQDRRFSRCVVKNEGRSPIVLSIINTHMVLES